MKINKEKSLLSVRNIVAVSLLLGLILGFGIVQIGKAQYKNNVSELVELAKALDNADAFITGIEYLKGETIEDVKGMLGGGVTRYPNGYIDTRDGYYVDGVEVIDNQGTKAPGPYSGSLIFTANSTSTPGGWFSVENDAGADMICDIGIHIATNEDTGNCAFNFAIATSGVATAWDNPSVTSKTFLMNTTTVATATVPYINLAGNPGGILQSPTNLPYASTTKFVFSDGDFVNGIYDAYIGQLTVPDYVNNASSSCFTSIAGKYYLDCQSL